MILGLPRPAILAINASGPTNSKLEHPGLPLSLQEMCECARKCQMAGASLYHLTVRDEAGKPTLQPEIVSKALSEIDAACEGTLPLQLNVHNVLEEEADKIFAFQREVVQTCQPKAISIAFRDLFPQGTEEKRELEARDFLDDCQSQNVAVQISFNHIADLDWFYAYRQYGMLNIDKPMLLLDLTGLQKKIEPNAHALRPFLAKLDQLNLLSSVHWSVCAPGIAELPTAAAVLALGGHCQIGFAHNIHNADGDLASDNASQLEPVKAIAELLGRPAASSFETLALLRG